jgi:hypothetical protein
VFEPHLLVKLGSLHHILFGHVLVVAVVMNLTLALHLPLLVHGVIDLVQLGLLVVLPVIAELAKIKLRRLYVQVLLLLILLLIVLRLTRLLLDIILLLHFVCLLLGSH